MDGGNRLLRTERAQFLVENLNLPAASGIADAVWEHFQLEHLCDDSIFRIERKSRQIAWSFLAAAEAIADCILDKRDSIFTSINHDEAKEKIRYAKAVYENLEIGGLPKLLIDNQLELEFETGVRISSHASRPVRGRPRSNWYGDEFAHVARDREIYKGSLPIVTKGGRVRLGSSPLGASGLFWEIYTEAVQPYPDYSRKSTPWWEVQNFCGNVAAARKLAPAMATAERVETFGKERIKAIFANMPVEDFQQEYECIFVDESTAWISWNEIKAVQDPDLVCISGTARNSEIAGCIDAINKLEKEIGAGRVERILYGGMDIGRTKNATEIFFVGKSTTDTYPLRLMLTMENCDFDSQLAVLEKCLEVLSIAKLKIDQTGIGRNLAEDASKRYPAKVEGVDFTNQSKQLWATDAKMIFQQHKTIIPVDRDLSYQIHSIKRLVSPSKNLIFDTSRNEKHHADKFWAFCLALSGAMQPVIRTDYDESESSWQY